MTILYRCPWCVVVKRGVRAPAFLRRHILKAHRTLLIDRLGLLEAFDTRKTLDPPRNAWKHGTRVGWGVSGEGDA